jgi:hypothetical protein
VCWIYLNAIASDPTLLPENLRSVSGVSTSFPVFTFILIVLIAYCIGAVFMEVFGQIIDTLLLCFCEDTEHVISPSKLLQFCFFACVANALSSCPAQHEQKYAPSSLKSSMVHSESNKVAPSE